jgi:putative membrane protein
MMLWPVAMIGLAILCAAAVVLFTDRFGSDTPWKRHGRDQTPSDILRERFARGEIDKDEYEERERFLSQH